MTRVSAENNPCHQAPKWRRLILVPCDWMHLFPDRPTSTFSIKPHSLKVYFTDIVEKIGRCHDMDGLSEPQVEACDPSICATPLPLVVRPGVESTG